ncbi:16907_t:CDS:1, partial [Funneliformis geosporum]
LEYGQHTGNEKNANYQIFLQALPPQQIIEDALLVVIAKAFSDKLNSQRTTIIASTILIPV